MKFLYRISFLVLLIYMPIDYFSLTPSDILENMIDFIEFRKLDRDSSKIIDPSSPEFSLQDALERIDELNVNRFLLDCRKSDPFEKADQFFHHINLPFKNKEFLMIMPNSIIFKNDEGSYLFDIIFTKNYSNSQKYNLAELLVIISTKKLLLPLYMFELSIKITVMGDNYSSQWTNEFFYDQKEINQKNPYSDRSVLTLQKTINQSDINRLKDIFKYNKKIHVLLEGLIGSFEFSLTEEQVNFYNKFFEYALTHKFYRQEVYYEQITR